MKGDKKRKIKTKNTTSNSMRNLAYLSTTIEKIQKQKIFYFFQKCKT